MKKLCVLLILPVLFLRAGAQAPNIVSFELADERPLIAGQQTLRWEVKGEDVNLSISPGVGPITGNSVVVYNNATEEIISFGDDWKYEDSGSDLGSSDDDPSSEDTWFSADYDDSVWAEGPGQLGYGDGDEATVIDFGGVDDAKHPAYYFRKTISLSEADLDQYKEMIVTILRDDGAIIYLNGNELARTNMPNTVVDGISFSDGTGVENGVFSFPVPRRFLREGENVFAVEVHQASNTSSDVSFDFQLLGFYSTRPVDMVTRENEWRYIDDGSEPAEDWYAPAFNDSAWKTGKGAFGFDQDDIPTILDFGPDPNNKITTYYFRKTFTVEDVDDIVALQLDAEIDDGAAIYINGALFATINLAAATIEESTFASATADAATEVLLTFFPNTTVTATQFTDRFKNLVVEGENVIAVEVHQTSLTSSDISFNMHLYQPEGANPATQPEINLINLGDVWRYDDTGTMDTSSADNPNDPGTWFGPNFNDSGWPSGPSELGYGDGRTPAQQETTQLSYGDDINNKYLAYYFRTQFDISQEIIDALDEFKLDIQRDDAVRVFLNGEELLRENLPPVTTVSVEDVSGNNQTAIGRGFTNGETQFNFSIFGQVDGMVDFLDGTSYLDTGSEITEFGSDFTISLWLNTTASDVAILSKSGDTAPGHPLTNDGEKELFITPFNTTTSSGGTIAFGTGADGAGLNRGTAVSSAQINDGVWHHVAVTFESASSTIEIYVDGVPTFTAAGSDYAGFADKFSDTVKLGFAAGDNAAGNYTGLLDDVAIFDRVLSESEVEEIISAGEGGDAFLGENAAIDNALVYYATFNSETVGTAEFEIDSRTLALAGATGVISYDLDPSILQPGTNHVAVELHQVNATSSDANFDMNLIGNIELDQASYTLTATNDEGSDSATIGYQIGSLPLSENDPIILVNEGNFDWNEGQLWSNGLPPVNSRDYIVYGGFSPPLQMSIDGTASPLSFRGNSLTLSGPGATLDANVPGVGNTLDLPPLTLAGGRFEFSGTGSVNLGDSAGGGELHITRDSEIVLSSTESTVLVFANFIGDGDLVYRQTDGNSGYLGLGGDNSGFTGSLIVKGGNISVPLSPSTIGKQLILDPGVLTIGAPTESQGDLVIADEASMVNLASGSASTYQRLIKPDGTLVAPGTYTVAELNGILPGQFAGNGTLTIVTDELGGGGEEDTDGDGLGDAWELSNFGDLSQPEDGDFDADAQSNLVEYAFGSDPTQPTSRVGTIPVANAQGAVSISFPTREGLRYQVQYRDNWDENWANAGGAMDGTGGTRTFTDNGTQTGSHPGSTHIRYYRVEVSQ